MQFAENNKVILDSMTEWEANAFVKFLMSEILRHQYDIHKAQDLIREVTAMYDLEDSNLGLDTGRG